ncbi:hypothetical protein [Staphylococcus phage LY01]|nr:hypothetical protein [Staphylococcus phage LY01]
MKKLLDVLTSIALVAVIIAAGLFGYSSIKGLNDSDSKKQDKTEVSKKEDKKENNNKEVAQQDQAQEVDNSDNQQDQVNADDTESINEEIRKADTNGDGIITTDEMTPELDRLAKEGKFQPVSPKMLDPEFHKKYELSEEEVQAAIEASDREMEQIEREESYNPNIPKEQMEIYEKQARGELPQPGEGPRSEVAEEDMIEE